MSGRESFDSFTHSIFVSFGAPSSVAECVCEMQQQSRPDVVRALQGQGVVRRDVHVLLAQGTTAAERNEAFGTMVFNHSDEYERIQVRAHFAPQERVAQPSAAPHMEAVARATDARLARCTARRALIVRFVVVFRR